MHAHPHEQVTIVQEEKLSMILNDETRTSERANGFAGFVLQYVRSGGEI